MKLETFDKIVAVAFKPLDIAWAVSMRVVFMLDDAAAWVIEKSTKL